MRRYDRNHEEANIVFGRWYITNNCNGRIAIFNEKQERDYVYREMMARRMDWDNLLEYLESKNERSVAS
jgi:tRNA(Phe) wybutosine-synthesizing methylase Tyw3